MAERHALFFWCSRITRNTQPRNQTHRDATKSIFPLKASKNQKRPASDGQTTHIRFCFADTSPLPGRELELFFRTLQQREYSLYITSASCVNINK